MEGNGTGNGKWDLKSKGGSIQHAAKTCSTHTSAWVNSKPATNYQTAIIVIAPSANMHIKLTMNAPDRMLGPVFGMRARRTNMMLCTVRHTVYV